jgi:transcriptional regulator with XRE-family HTH domain
MTPTVQSPQRPVGELLRQWRERRRLSQLELALQAEVSTRHLSFVETGRSAPSRAMVLHLAEELELPLRERNQMLMAAGYAPIYSESTLAADSMAAVRTAIRQLLASHEPYPALVVDGAWTIVDANASVALFMRGISDDLLAPPVNALRLSLHPDGLAPRIVNHGEWRAHILARLRHQLDRSGDERLARLYDELRVYPCADPRPEVELPGPGAVIVPLRLRDGERQLAFLSTTAVFGTPLDITVAELAIESFFPADAETAAALHRHDSS